MRMKWQVMATLAALTVASGCTVAVSGSAAPVPGQGPIVKAVDACSLLDEGQLDALGYEAKGRSVPENKDRNQTAMCLWNTKVKPHRHHSYFIRNLIGNTGQKVTQPIQKSYASPAYYCMAIGIGFYAEIYMPSIDNMVKNARLAVNVRA
jgi:hypothetical protein